MEISEVQRKALYAVSRLLCTNGSDENEAVRGYTEQLEAIDCAIALFAGVPDVVTVLTTIRAATEEKISDELNHAHSLLSEYETLMGIDPATD